MQASWVIGSSFRPSEENALAVDRVGVRRGDDVGPRGVHGRVDHEGRAISPALAFDDLTLVVDENQIGDSDVAEVHAEGVDPEVVQQFGVPGRDVPATPSEKPSLPKTRNAPARRSLRCCRSASMVEKVAEH